MNDLCGPRNEVTYICCLEFVLSLNVVYFADPTTKELFDFSFNRNTLSSHETSVKETYINYKDRFTINISKSLKIYLSFWIRSHLLVSYTCLIINYNKILCYQLLGFRLLLCVPALNFLFVTLFSVAFFTWLWTKNLVFKPQSYLFPSIGSKWNAPVTKSHTLPEQTSNNSVIWWQRHHRKMLCEIS